MAASEQISAGAPLSKKVRNINTNEYSDPSCFVTAPEAWAQKQAGEALIVDVRSPLDFHRYYIPHSLNVPLYAVREKLFLRQQAILLVNDGRSERELVRACHALRRSGFDHVAVVRGGLRAWLRANQPVAGDPAGIAEFLRLRPRDLYLTRHERDWLLIGTPADLADTQKLLPDLERLAIPTGSELPLASDVLRDRLLTAERLLVITTHGNRHEPIEAALRQLGRIDALVLEGGLAAYQTYLANRQRLLRTSDGGRHSVRCSQTRAGS